MSKFQQVITAHNNPQNILVVNASAVGSVAVIRSLWLAGHRVHACDPSADAIGFYSNGAYMSEVCPPFACARYVPWLIAFIQTHKISVIIPNEDFLIAIKDKFAQFSGYLPIAQDYDTVFNGMSKWELFYRLASQQNPSIKQNLPKHLLITKNLNNLSELQGLHLPLFIKYDLLHQNNPSKYRGVIKAENYQDARNIIMASFPDYNNLLIQEHCPGVGCGVFLLLWHGEVKAHFMHLRCHEVPYTGGASSYRKSWWHQGMYQDAVDKAKAMNWQGVIMIEYRWQPDTDKFNLMEMNCRFWGSLHLALYAGVDFPKLLIDNHLGDSPTNLFVFNQNISCRLTFPQEVHYLLSIFKSKELPPLKKLKALFEFFYLFFVPNVKSDYWYPGDRALYWRRLLRFIKSYGG